MSALAAAPAPASAGRRAGAARSAGRSRCRPSAPPRTPSASPRTNSVEPAADVDDQERRLGGGPTVRPRARRGRRWRRGTTARPPRRRSPRRAPAEGGRHHVLEVGAVGGVAGGAGGHHPHRGRPEVAGLARRTRRGRAGCARWPRGPAGRWRRRPGRAGRPPSAAPGRCARRRPATSATSRRIELVPQSIAATRVTRSSSAACAQGPAAHHSPISATARSPIGLTPGPAARACPARACRHLTRSGIPPAVARVGSTSRASRRGQVQASCAARYRGGQLGVGGQLVLPLAHPPGGLQPAGGGVGPRAGQVVERRERGAVLAAAARSRRRRAARTGSGARPRRARAAAGPSWRSIDLAARRASTGGLTSRSGLLVGRPVAVGHVERVHQALVPGARLGRGRSPPRARRASPATVAAVDDHDQPVPGQHVGQPLARLALGDGGIGLPLQLRLEVGDPPVEVLPLRGERASRPGRRGTGGPARRGSARAAGPARRAAPPGR